jgi:hypothetical protein
METIIENKGLYIHIKIGGQISLDASEWKKIESIRNDVVDTIKKTGVYKLLFDCRDLSGKISIVNRFLLATFFVKENIKFIIAQAPLLKVAFVLNQSMIDAERIGAKVAHNRGLRGILTTNMQEALQWLDLDVHLEEEP